MAIVVVVTVAAVAGVLGLLGVLATPSDDGTGTPVAEPVASTPVPMETAPPVETPPVVENSGPSMEPTAAPDPSASALEAVFTVAVKQRKALKDADSYKLGRLGWNMCGALEEGKGFAEAVALGRSGFDEETSAYMATLAIGNLCPRQQDKIPGWSA
ncbi:DUF732 domain-containing protein [Streptosporangium algeriense]|uniref:DUF732 domain-containing protein n=1 Tax=Streptosporangium algeriense TaxID=1682748 RepID=A0ABW3DWE1_9ACTN